MLEGLLLHMVRRRVGEQLVESDDVTRNLGKKKSRANGFSFIS